MIRSLRLIATFALYLVVPNAALAEQQANSTISFTTINKQSFKQDWGLSDEEFDQYTKYMNSTGRFFYTHLDPLMVLGFIETDPGKRDRLAERYLTKQNQRIDQELSFVEQIQYARKRLFPNAKMYDFSKVAGYDRYQQKKHAFERAVQVSRDRTAIRNEPIDATISTYDWNNDDDVVSVEYLITKDCIDCEKTVRELLANTPETVIIELYASDADLDVLKGMMERLSDTIKPSRVISAKSFDPILFSSANDIRRPVVRNNGVVVARL